MSRQEKRKRERFARKAMRALQHAGEPGTLTYDESSFGVLNDGEPFFNLGRLYERYVATNPSRRSEVFRDIELRHRAALYNQQDCSPREGHVARVSLREEKANPGRLMPVALLTCGLDTLLPRVDRLMVMYVPECGHHRCIAPHGVATWERFETVLGDRLVPQGLDPERYRVQFDPTDQELSALELTPAEQHRGQED